MRSFALLLILANVCFLFWSQYIDVQPEPPAVDDTHTSQTPRLLLARERSQGDATAAAPTQLTCISIGPFPQASDAGQAQQRLQAAGYDITAHSEAGEVFAGYWVSLPSIAKRVEAEQALQRLRAAGINDAYLLAEENPPVISLGLFNEQSHAERRRDEAAQLGFAPQIQTRTRAAELQWLDVSLKQPGELIDPALLQPEGGGIMRLETRPCPNANSASRSNQG